MVELTSDSEIQDEVPTAEFAIQWLSRNTDLAQLAQQAFTSALGHDRVE